MDTEHPSTNTSSTRTRTRTYSYSYLVSGVSLRLHCDVLDLHFVRNRTKYGNGNGTT